MSVKCACQKCTNTISPNDFSFPVCSQCYVEGCDADREMDLPEGSDHGNK